MLSFFVRQFISLHVFERKDTKKSSHNIINNSYFNFSYPFLKELYNATHLLRAKRINAQLTSRNALTFQLSRCIDFRFGKLFV